MNGHNYQVTDSSVDLSVAPAVVGAPDEQTKIVLYDADAEQRVLFHTEKKGRTYKAVHIFKAGAVKDEAVLEYERSKDQRMSDVDITESNEKDAIAITSQGFKAALEFWEKYCDRVEGYANPDRVSTKDKAFAVGVLFGTEFKELPVAMDDELIPDDDDENSTYRMNCVDDGQVIATVHELRPATTDEISESQALQSRSLIVQGTKFGQRDQRIPSRAKRWGELYDLMKISASGYVRKVPLHHKMVVVQRHLKSEQQAITGN